MMRLTKVELRRLFSRRLTSMALLCALAVTALMSFSSYQQAKPVSGAALISQRAAFARAQQEWKQYGPGQIRACQTAQTDARKTDPKANLGCDQLKPNWQTWAKPLTSFPAVMPGVLLAGSYLLAFVGFVVGAGFLAAEFSSGSMANWLTFEPRRMRVYATKLAAAGLGLVPVTVVLLGLLTAGTWLIIGHLGSTAGTISKVWGDLAGTGGRAVARSLAATVTGAAIGVLLGPRPP
jgi:ABC-2 type transport system permease protein